MKLESQSRSSDQCQAVDVNIITDAASELAEEQMSQTLDVTPVLPLPAR